MFKSDNLIDRIKTTIKIDYLSEKIFRYQIELLDKGTIEKFSSYKDFHWQNWATNNLTVPSSNISNLFNQFNFYQFPEFIKFLKSMSNFNEHIKNLKSKLGDPKFIQIAQNIYLNKYETLQDFINNEFSKIQHQEAFLKQKESNLSKIENKRRTTFENKIKSVQEALKISDSLASQLINGDLIQQVQDQFLEENLYKNNNFDNEDYFNKQHKNYAINLNVEKFLLDKGITTNKYKECFGNNIQHKIHYECLKILNKAYNLNKLNLSSELRNLSDEIIQINNVSIEANRYGKINLATNLNKYSKATLKWLYTFARGGPLVKWIHEGSWIGIQRVAHTVAHPVELVQNSIKMGKSIYKIFSEISGFLDDIQILNLINNPERIQNRVERYTTNATQFYNFTTNFITEKSKSLTLKDIPEITENITKEVAANIVEAYLTGKALSALGNIISKTPKAIHFVEHNFRALPKEKIVSLATMESGEVIQVRLVEDGTKLLAQDNNQITGKVKRLIHISENQVKISATENGARVIAANEAVNQIEKNKLLWNTWQNLPKSKINNLTVAKVGDFYYTEHAIARTLPLGLGNPASISAYSPNTPISHRYGRGIPLIVVDDVAKNGIINDKAKSTLPVIEKFLNNVAVRIDPNTNIIYTIMTRKEK